MSTGAPVSLPPPGFSSNAPTTPADCEAFAAQLLDPSISIRRKLELASELRDSAETNRDFAFYEKYLGILIPALITILGDEKSITFSRESVDQVGVLFAFSEYKLTLSVSAIHSCPTSNDYRTRSLLGSMKMPSWSS